MRAVLCERFGPPDLLQVREVPDPVPGPGEVLIDVSHAGVGFVDGLMVQGLYQVKSPLPFIPGGEMAGRVAALGKGVSDWSVGDRVMSNLSAGAFAEKLAAPADQCVAVPDNMDSSVAAGFLLNHATTLHGLRDRGGLVAGETVLVLGASGGVGLAAMAVAKAFGARVIAAASSGPKRARALAAGADLAVDYTAENWRRDLADMTSDSGLQMVVDPVGGAAAEAAMRSLSWGGRHLVFGFASGTIPKVGLNITLLKQCQVVGVDWGANLRHRGDYAMAIQNEAADMVRDGRLTPAPVSVRGLEDAARVLRDQLDRKAEGKIVLAMGA